MTTVRVLLVEDSASDAELMLRALRGAGLEPVHERVDNPEAMRQALKRQSWDVVLSDYSMPAFDAPAALVLLQQHSEDIPFIVVSGSVGEDTAVAVMAHDFNNVLTAILGSAELLLLDSPPGAHTREELHIIRDAATRAQDLIRQLLAFSARQVLQPVVLDLNHLVKNVGKMLRRLIGEDIKLVSDLAPELAAVRADPGQIEQVLVNLAVNARDAMPDGGRLAIKSFNAEVSEGDVSAPNHVPPGSYAVLEVSDTGSGMSAETQARIFEPFFTTKAQGKGTGLGLATVYGVVRQSDGHISVESAPGAGATFRVYLPRVDETVTPAATPGTVTAPAVGRETVLLAEDEPLVRLLARRVLEQAGYTVLVASGGAEALETARRHDGPIHLLLTDVVMPEMSGRDLVRHLLDLRPGVPVLYMTGYSDEAIARHGVLDPGTALIQKPFTPAALARKVREALDARS